MQTIKGLIGLALVAAAVFIAVLIYNNGTEPSYIAKVHEATLKETTQVAKSAVSPAAHARIAGHKTKTSNL
jgi:hypothetical protein